MVKHGALTIKPGEAWGFTIPGTVGSPHPCVGSLGYQETNTLGLLKAGTS
jgi:hypothetical protein